MLRYRRSPRLPHFDYAGNYAYFLTIVTRQRRRVFSDHAVVKRVALAMERAALKHRFEVHTYCFMPDHLHLLLSGEDGSSLKEFVRQFKQISSFEYKDRHGMQLWQISYYDRVLRSDEDLDSVARYIWGTRWRPGLSRIPGTTPSLGRGLCRSPGWKGRPEGLQLLGLRGFVP